MPERVDNAEAQDPQSSRQAVQSHRQRKVHDHKSPKRKRFLGTMAVVDERDADNVRAMLPYS